MNSIFGVGDKERENSFLVCVRETYEKSGRGGNKLNVDSNVPPPHYTLYYEAGIIALVGGGGGVLLAAVLDCDNCRIRPCTRSLAVSSMELLVTKP